MSVMVSTTNIRPFGADGYEETPERQVVLKYGRYRLTKHKNATTAYTVWYGGSILKMGQRSECIESFKQRVGEMQGILL